MRAVLASAALLLASTLAAPAQEARIVAADFTTPTARYDHGILGDIPAWGEMVVTLSSGHARRVVLPETRVFEDIAPRLVDVTGDDAPEIVVVETDVARGARLSVYDARGLVAAGPFIGRPHRWLAPVAVADLDGDGATEFAWIDRPHLARTLRVWRRAGRELVEVARMGGVTNHRIGDEHISGGLRDCGAGPEMIVASADWRRVVAVRLAGDELVRRDLGPADGPASFREALDCAD
ncbi:hypothetical protein C2I36_07230 [Rhodobacteraceae bacterium WD3A24]|nr:hypothetical protein C2I36_07230 [Rhodobacteraceae bacterium WD3A24]